MDLVKVKVLSFGRVIRLEILTKSSLSDIAC